MEDILDMLEGFIDLVSSLGEFVLDWIKDLLYIIELLSTIILNLPSIFGWMPVPVFATVSSIFGVVVLYKILGREG